MKTPACRWCPGTSTHAASIAGGTTIPLCKGCLDEVLVTIPCDIQHHPINEQDLVEIAMEQL